MKIKVLLGTVLSLAILLSANTSFAQHKAHPVAKKHIAKQHHKAAITHKRGNMVQAHKVLKRTNKAIVAANVAVKKNKNYTGHLSKAVYHQRHAKTLLKRGKTHRAMQHSRLARKNAFVAMRNNKTTVSKDLDFTAEENKMLGETITDTELEKELKTENPKVSFDDKNVSDKDMSDIEVLETNPANYKNN